MEIVQPAGGDSNGVDSLNGLTGDVILAAGANITLGTIGNTITINSSAAGVTSFNTRTGAVTLTSGDVTTALGFTPGTGNGTVTSVSGTTNRITSTGGTTPVIDISALYIGQSSITTLGTISTGVWQGTAIAPAYMTAMTATVGGAVPTPPNNTSTFLRGDGTFAAPTGGAGTVTTLSVVTANGISGSVANPTTTPAITLTLGAITPSSVTASGDLTANNYSSTVLTRTLPSAVNDYVNIGSFVRADGPFNLYVSIIFDTGAGADSIAKQYFVSGFYDASGLYGGNWAVVTPVSKADRYGVNNFVLEALQATQTLSLRIHKTVGTGSFAGRVQIVDYGASVFTPSTSTGTAAQVPYVWYGGVAPLGIPPSDNGSYNLNNWNSVGGPIADFFGTNQNNGGSTPAVPQPALVLTRAGVGGQSYANYAEFNVSRYENVSTNARTQLDFALTQGNGDATGTTIMSLRGNGNVGVGVSAPLATLHLKAGTASANTAPLKFNSGTLLTSAETGAVEFLTDKFYGTITTGAARKEFTLNDAALTSGTIPIATTNGRLTDSTSATLTTAGVTNVVTNVSLTGQAADIATVTLASTAGLYRVSYSLQDTTADVTAGAVVLTLSYTDGAGATTNTATQSLVGVGRQAGSVYLQLASGNLTYATTHTGLFGTATYALYITVERIK